MKATPQQLVREEILALKAYSVTPAAGMIKLDAMENPYRLPEALREEVGRLVSTLPINRYPDPTAPELKARLRAAFPRVVPYLTSIPLYGGLWMMACAAETLDPAAVDAVGKLEGPLEGSVAGAAADADAQRARRGAGDRAPGRDHPHQPERRS